MHLVILSGAPQDRLNNFADGRGVEKSRRSLPYHAASGSSPHATSCERLDAVCFSKQPRDASTSRQRALLVKNSARAPLSMTSYERATRTGEISIKPSAFEGCGTPANFARLASHMTPTTDLPQAPAPTQLGALVRIASCPGGHAFQCRFFMGSSRTACHPVAERGPGDSRAGLRRRGNHARFPPIADLWRQGFQFDPRRGVAAHLRAGCDCGCHVTRSAFIGGSAASRTESS